MAREQVIQTFCQALGIERTGPVADALTAALLDAHTDWPPDWLSENDFAGVLAERIDESDDVATALERCVASDLYVAAAVLDGQPEAMRVFDGELESALTTALGKLGASPQECAEVGQQVRQRLLVPTPERRARLADYEGRGPLRSWLRATVGRTFLNLRRGEKREVLVDDEAVLDALHEGGVDAELAHMRETYKKQFRESFHQALAGLTDRQKVLLRYRFVDRVSIDKIGKIYNVHRATVHRWLAEARSDLAIHTEKNLRTRLGLSPSEFHSIRRLVVSQLDVSLSRVLGSAKPLK